MSGKMFFYRFDIAENNDLRGFFGRNQMSGFQNTLIFALGQNNGFNVLFCPRNQTI